MLIRKSAIELTLFFPLILYCLNAPISISVHRPQPTTITTQDRSAFALNHSSDLHHLNRPQRIKLQQSTIPCSTYPSWMSWATSFCWLKTSFPFITHRRSHVQRIWRLPTSGARKNWMKCCGKGITVATWMNRIAKGWMLTQAMCCSSIQRLAIWSSSTQRLLNQTKSHCNIVLLSSNIVYVPM